MDWWTHFLNMLHSEFSDIKDLTELFRMTIRLLLAAILGGLLGLERESVAKIQAYAPTCWWPWVQHFS